MTAPSDPSSRPSGLFNSATGNSARSAQKEEEKPVSLYKPRQSTPFTGFGQSRTAAQGDAKGAAHPFSSSGRPTPGSAGANSPRFQSALFKQAAAATDAGKSAFQSRFAAQTGIDRGAPSPLRPNADQMKPFSLRSKCGDPTQSPASSFKPKTATSGTRAASPFRKDLQISDEEFLLIRDFIYQQCGIFIAENRKYLVENRLSNRIKDLNLKSYNEYYNFLRFDPNKRQELNKLFEVVTTNETSFFRNPPQLQIFQNVVLANAIEQARKAGQKKLRIWSAGCSTGEEPYTMAIILHEVLKSDIKNWDIKITANDLSEAVLAAARRGVYNEYAIRTTPPELVNSYFTKEGNLYKLDPALKRLVSFGQINLNDREQLKRVEKSQIVFCRNVIIYFDDEMKRKVINAFYDNLLPNGALLIGHSESLHNISRAFKVEQHKGTIVYRKPD